MYLLYGNNLLEINNKIEELKKDLKTKNVIKFDLNESTLEDVINEACYFDLFGLQKFIIVNNCYFLTAKFKEDTFILSKYLLNPNEKSTIVFTLNEEKLDERKKIVKEINNKCKVFKFNYPNKYDLVNIINDELKKEKYKIEKEALNELVDRIKNNSNVVYNELKKLMLYKMNEKVITLKDVYSLVPKPLEDNIFSITSAIVSKDKSRIFNSYIELMKSKTEPLVIIALLASQFRLYLNISILKNESKTLEEMKSILNENPYRIELAFREVDNFTKNQLISYIYELYNIDYSIKTGESFHTLEMFFLNM